MTDDDEGEYIAVQDAGRAGLLPKEITGLGLASIMSSPNITEIMKSDKRISIVLLWCRRRRHDADHAKINIINAKLCTEEGFMDVIELLNGVELAIKVYTRDGRAPDTPLPPYIIARWSSANRIKVTVLFGDGEGLACC